MFDRIKKLFAYFAPEDEPESVDHPKPRRANANPPQRDWYARVRERSDTARDPALSPEASRAADELLARSMQTARK